MNFTIGDIPEARVGAEIVLLVLWGGGGGSLTWQKQVATSHPGVESTASSATLVWPCWWNCWTALPIPSALRLGTHLAKQNRIVQMVVPSGSHSRLPPLHVQKPELTLCFWLFLWELIVIQVIGGGGGGVFPSTQRYYRRFFLNYLLLFKLLHVSVVRPSSSRYQST
jgi:hypothetical protein